MYWPGRRTASEFWSSVMAKYVTKQRKILLEYMTAHADEMMSAEQIAEELADKGVSKSAVYRNLAELENEGRVSRISRAGVREGLYRFTDAEECREHLHLSCVKCGKTFHMGVKATEKLIGTVEQDTDFYVDNSTVLYGVCGDCRKCEQAEKPQEQKE